MKSRLRKKKKAEQMKFLWGRVFFRKRGLPTERLDFRFGMF